MAPGFPARIEKIVERVGLPAAKALWALSEAGVRYCARQLAELADGRRKGRAGSTSPRPRTPRRRWPAARLLGQEFGAEVEGWALERVREVLKSRQYFHAVHFPRAFQINPLAYALALAGAAERAGAHIFEHTPALSIDPAGVRKRIATPKACCAPAASCLPATSISARSAERLAETLVPIAAYAGVTGPLGRRRSLERDHLRGRCQRPR